MKYFGTDGIRGHCGTYPITPDFMLKLGWAAGKVFAESGRSKILIGKDTRISGYMFESALQAGLSAAGVDVLLLGPMPTPAIAYLTRTFHADAGIVISASHNGYQDNGIKFFSAKGTKLPDEVEAAIESKLQESMECVPAEMLGKAFRISDAAGRYIEFCKGTVGPHTSLRGLKIVLDCAHGATYHIAPSVLHELGADLISIGIDPDGMNINEECGSMSIATVRKLVCQQEADLGIALDGDGDRVIMVDHMGEEVDGDELMFIIAADQKRQGLLEGGVVGTQMSNLGMELALQELGIDFARAKVGDRYVMAELKKRGWILGGESSGHLVCRKLTSTGDGIVAALRVLQAMRRTGKSLHELKSQMQKMPQSLVNVRFPTRVDLAAYPEVQAQVAIVEQRLAGKGRVLLRPSGTEPVVRVMVEGENADLTNQFANELAHDVRQIVG
ncbi:MAG: phosphoglucosamine mutase [Gammaproteobacteria bacterium]|nr:phosphoglucosamine mutase [Gammaproteobacteria bacterium]